VLLWSAVRIYRDGLASSLMRDERIGNVMAVADPAACRERALRIEPDVAVIDAGSPVAVHVASELRACGVGVVALGIAVPEADVVALAEAGVAAYLTQDQGLEELMLAIHAVARGETDCNPRVTALLLRHMASGGGETRRPNERTVRLTRREAEILRLMWDGLANKQIGAALDIELPTVKNHVHHILQKLGAGTRAEAVAMTRGARSDVAVELAGV
jgi:two-component system, NarL family, nitrate/nitrite response regulator NarL